jgi:hypothetical protein
MDSISIGWYLPWKQQYEYRPPAHQSIPVHIGWGSYGGRWARWPGSTGFWRRRGEAVRKRRTGAKPWLGQGVAADRSDERLCGLWSLFMYLEMQGMAVPSETARHAVSAHIVPTDMPAQERRHYIAGYRHCSSGFFFSSLFRPSRIGIRSCADGAKMWASPRLGAAALCSACAPPSRCHASSRRLRRDDR